MLQRKYIFLALVALFGVAVYFYSRHDSTPPPPIKKAEKVRRVHKKPLPLLASITVESSVDKKQTTIKMPYRRPGVDGEILNFNLEVIYAQGQSTQFYIVPDDCLDKLEINGKEVMLTGDALARRCDWEHGFRMDLQPYLNDGVNKVHIVVSNISGWTGLYFIPKPR